MVRHGQPDIFNTDQGSQFTSVDFTTVLKKAEIAISMDGKGAWRDNVFVERLWRSVKYEEIYLRAYDTVSMASASIGRLRAAIETERSSFSRSNGSRRCSLLTTTRSRNWIRSNVVKRPAQSGQTRRRRMALPSSAERESFTCDSCDPQ